ncbi:hypothetical protein O53_1376 [Microcystis aeruginosa TAIHU98]|uniref:Uncharacterized protein n=1 Tax=Microcystis aeruginosa TAIHU98 TaxID=1134457 RepID=L7EEP9_MICAE|nr:hypothetical protein O53_1376 [Microcystis aeruginosa TAIHU98]
MQSLAITVILVPVLIRSIFQFDNAYCRANSGISPTPSNFSGQ